MVLVWEGTIHVICRIVILLEMNFRMMVMSIYYDTVEGACCEEFFLLFTVLYNTCSIFLSSVTALQLQDKHKFMFHVYYLFVRMIIFKLYPLLFLTDHITLCSSRYLRFFSVFVVVHRQERFH